jgi:PAS domain S-box-containing protein
MANSMATDPTPPFPEPRDPMSDAVVQVGAGTSADAVVWVDAEGIVAEATNEAARMFGYRRDELVGLPARALLLTPNTADEVEEAALSGRPIRVLARGRDGTAVAIDVVMAPLPTDAGLYRLTAFEALGPVEDTPGRAGGDPPQLYAPEVVAQAARSAAHDLNNDLGAILNLAALVGRNVDDPAVRADLDAINQLVDHAAGVARRVLTFARLDPAAAYIDVAAVVHDIELLLRNAAGDAPLVLGADGGPAMVAADRRDIEDILVRLVVHARTALPAVASITIVVGNVELDAWSAAAVGVAPGDHVRIAVSAVPVEVPDAEPEQDGHVEGMGLGPLEPASDAVRHLGGRLDAHFSPRGGPMATAYLPRAAVEPVAPLPPPRLSPGEAEPRRILVVDDSSTVLYVTRRMLADRGYRVDVADSATAALEVLAGRPDDIALVLSDITLPDISGIELARRCRSLRPDVSVVLMSGHADPAGSRDNGAEPDVPFLVKPFTEEALFAAVRQALGPGQGGP